MPSSEITHSYLRDVLFFLDNYFKQMNQNLPKECKAINWHYIYISNNLTNKFTIEHIKYILETLYLQEYIHLSNFKRIPDGEIAIFIVDGITDKGYKFLIDK